jgi:hypothetical protein
MARGLTALRSGHQPEDVDQEADGVVELPGRRAATAFASSHGADGVPELQGRCPERGRDAGRRW